MSKVHNRRLLASLSWAVVIAIVGAAGVFAGAQFAPRTEVVTAADPVVYTVVNGSVGRTLRYEAQASWPLIPWAIATQSGVVTTVDLAPNGVVSAGAQLLSVGLRPLIALPGDIPASRDLSINSIGGDVKQLQDFLVSNNKLSEANATGTFNNATQQAVISWQREVGFTPADGVVRLGDVVFFPELPAIVSIPSGVQVGGIINAGQALLSAVTGQIVIEIITGAEQAALIPQDNEIIASVGGFEWVGVFGLPYADSNNMIHIPLENAGGGPICGDDCAAALEVGRIVPVAVEVIQVPLTTGPVVPTTALRTEPSGQVIVTSSDGNTIPVIVTASYGGLAIVDNLSVGTEILLFGGQ